MFFGEVFRSIPYRFESRTQCKVLRVHSHAEAVPEYESVSSLDILSTHYCMHFATRPHAIVQPHANSLRRSAGLGKGPPQPLKPNLVETAGSSEVSTMPYDTEARSSFARRATVAASKRLGATSGRGDPARRRVVR